MIKIKKVKAILTAPQGTNLIIIKVETTELGLYSLGCGTFAYREKAVACNVKLAAKYPSKTKITEWT